MASGEGCREGLQGKTGGLRAPGGAKPFGEEERDGHQKDDGRKERGGQGECGVCAVRTRSGWSLACKDGPVYDLAELEE